MIARITFHGGAGAVTGANFLLDTGDHKFLVDCGTREQEFPPSGGCDITNLEAFPYDPGSIDALFVTHAHQDHIGRIPRLVRAGFRGPIYSTFATKDVSAVMFDDALGVMQEHSDRHGCEMLYGAEDVQRALAQWHGLKYHEPLAQGDVTVELSDAGHVLGSALVRFSRGGRSVLFTGDLGNSPEPLLPDTESPEGATYIVMESVYGDRVHEERADRQEALRRAIDDVRAHHGALLIPSFSLERTQILLHEINDLVESGKMQPIPVYLDSPLAIRLMDVYRQHRELFNAAIQEHFKRGDDPFSFSGFKMTHSTEESRAIHRESDPKVIIAGAGMSGGGRVRSHEKYYLGERSAALLFVGYQAPGTLGRRIEDGASSVRIDNEIVHIKARVSHLTGYSGHADRDQLLSFVERAGEKLERVFVTMGEPRSSLFLAQRIKDFLGVQADIPQLGDTKEIEL